MKTYFKWPWFHMAEQRSGKDRRVNPEVITDPEERKRERRKGSRRMFEGFIISLISGSKTFGKENPTNDIN